jgi:hypothetical protein
LKAIFLRLVGHCHRVVVVVVVSLVVAVPLAVQPVVVMIM